ncbi:MAG: SpoIIE family protein phosphatase [Candidatus Delongbacteria bacterium]|nr:SpoIIE family protein phosphatase [Candidatus Delongbacteria bacterium]MBN2836824.1 SpoIIE family protein phosphatase [Candidatus Delongbacteria bacterium]
MAKRDFFTDIHCEQEHKAGKYCFGDVFLSRKIKEEGRTLIVLSDGMGSGAKANVLATLTASMSINFNLTKGRLKEVSEIIMDILPICSVRKVSYSTFTIAEIENDGTIHIVEYENPKAIILRNNEIITLKFEEIRLSGERHAGKILTYFTYKPLLGDRIIFWSDGITQSGLGSKGMPLGWGLNNVIDFVKKIVKMEPDISSSKLCRKVINRAVQNDGFQPKDDISCVSIYYRKPRKLLICTGPPYDSAYDYQFAEEVSGFDGEKIVCGGTTADILVRELNLTITQNMKIMDKELPPMSYIEGFELVTEGVMTLDKTLRILDKMTKEEELENGPADQIIKMILKHDEIYFLTGSRLNETNFDPNLEVELKIRKFIVERMRDLLEDKFMKDVNIRFM